MVLACLVGLICVLPQLLLIYSIRDNYRGIIYSGSNDDYTYLVRMHEILDGHWLATSPFFYEYKSYQPLVLPAGEQLYAIASFVTQASLPMILLVSKFLLPAILFLLVYAIIIRLTENFNSPLVKFNAMAGGLFVTLGYDFIDFKNAFEFLLGQRPWFHPLIWVRPVNPIVGALFLFTFILLLWILIIDRKRYFTLLLGVLQALMVSYFFSWGLSLSIICFLILLHLFRKEYQIVKDLILVVFLGFLFSLPYWIKLFYSLGVNNDSASKMGMFYTHKPVVNKFVLVGLILYALLMIFTHIKQKKINKNIDYSWWFSLAMLGGCFWVYIQQIFTGRTIWPGHFVQYTIPITIIVAFFSLLAICSKKSFKYFYVVLLSIIIIVTISYGIMSAMSFKYDANSFLQNQKYASLLNWLDSNSENDCVVLSTDYRFQYLNPAYTHCNDYVSDWSFSGVPLERVEFNYLVLLRLKNIDINNISSYLHDNMNDIRLIYYKDWDQLYSTSDDEPWLIEAAQKVELDYRNFLDQDFYQELKKYKLDYLVMNEAPSQDISSHLNFIGNFEGLMLYKFD